MQEKDKRHCKACKQLVNRILDGKFDRVNKRWIDETGSVWNGNTCPACNKNRVKQSMQILRTYQKAK